MPSITGYNPQARKDLRQQPAADDDPVTNPNGVFSGMTLGLAIGGDRHAMVENMPPDSRLKGTLEDQNPHYD